MNAIAALAHKDLVLLWRDKQSLFWLIGFPLVFAAIFGSIFGGSGPGTGNPLRIAVIADGLDDAGRTFAARLDASDAVEVESMPRDAATDAVRTGRKAAFLEVVRMPANAFAMLGGDPPEIRVGIDPSRQAEKGMLQGLVMEATFAGFRELFADPATGRAEALRLLEQLETATDVDPVQRLVLGTFFRSLESFLAKVDMPGRGSGSAIEPKLVEVPITRERTGPPSAYSISFPQSILWAIMGAAAGFAITLVRERRDGTMVRLLTAPLPRWKILAGKALACFLTGCAIVAFLLLVGTLVFGVEVDSLPLVALATACAAACFAGLTMFLSSLGRTEQAVSGFAWGLLVVFAMLGGGMVPQIAMPAWMLAAGSVSPAKWTVEALEGGIWRGYSLAEIAVPCAVLIGFGAAAFAVGAWRLRRAP